MSAKRIFITGGASGLGRALAERYAREGWRVCIGDLNEAKGREVEAILRKTAPAAQFIKCDVTREADLLQVASWIESEWGGLDILVNNAGVALAGPLASLEIKDWEWLLDINLLGLVRGCRVFIPIFLKQGHGQIVNTASMAGIVHPPLMAAYNAAKAGVIAVSETLKFELSRDAIDVSVVCPSFFRTNLVDTSRASDPKLTTAMRKLVNGAPRSAEQIADAVFAGVSAKRFMILTDGEGRLIRSIKRFFPFSFYTALLSRQFNKMQGRS